MPVLLMELPFIRNRAVKQAGVTRTCNIKYTVERWPIRGKRSASQRIFQSNVSDWMISTVWGQGSRIGSRRSNAENQRNDLISHDCGTIASPCRCVTICIHDYRPREAERTRGKKKRLNSLGEAGRGEMPKMCLYPPA